METRRRRKVAVLFGGRSAEHSVSILSARSVANAMDREAFEPVPVGIDRTGRWFVLSKQVLREAVEEVSADPGTEVFPTRGDQGRIAFLTREGIHTRTEADVVFPVLHGPYGEDGTLQGMLEMLGVPYVGCGVLGSAVGMDKDVQKRLFRDSGLPVVEWETVSRRRWEKNREEVIEKAMCLGNPLFVKPARLGSSVGIRRVEDEPTLITAVETAFSYDSKVLIERGVNAREVECAVLGNENPQASVPGEIEPGADFYSYEAKYDPASRARLRIPAPVAPDLADRIRSMAKAAFECAQCSGMTRVDFLLDRLTEEIFINEINTIPGFTSISMYPKLWEATGVPLPDLITQLITLALEKRRDQESPGTA